jgi:hypothetical protein
VAAIKMALAACVLLERSGRPAMGPRRGHKRTLLCQRRSDQWQRVGRPYKPAQRLPGDAEPDRGSKANFAGQVV